VSIYFSAAKFWPAKQYDDLRSSVSYFKIKIDGGVVIHSSLKIDGGVVIHISIFIFESVAIDSFNHKVGANTGIYQAKVQVPN
jgi:hypothetical protein